MNNHYPKGQCAFLVGLPVAAILSQYFITVLHT